MFPDRESRRAEQYARAPLNELLALLLRQWKRPLAGVGITITDADAAALAQAMVRGTDDARLPALREALTSLVRESHDVLSTYGLTFADSLNTNIGDLSGWETTADFLALAEIKSNAELRISTGSALLVALGDRAFAPALTALVERGVLDLDSAVAKRVLEYPWHRGTPSQTD
jgi:hypothetical protein